MNSNSAIINGNVSSSGGFQCRTRATSKYKAEGDRFVEHLEEQFKAPKDLKLTTVYDYQIEAVLNTRTYLKREGTKAQPALIVAPTGTGKSGMVAMLPYCLESKKVLVLSPSLDVTTQLRATFGNGKGGIKKSFFWESRLFTDQDQLIAFLENPTVIKEPKDFLESTDLAKLVIVNAQKFGGQSGASLVNKNEEVVKNAKEAFKSFDTLIVDEAHHYPAPTWKNIVKEFKDKQIVFLTATPWRRGKNGERIAILDLQKITHEIKKELVEGDTIRKSEFKNFEFDNFIPTRVACVKDQEIIKQIGTKIQAILDRHNQENPAVRHKAMCFVRTKEAAKTCATWLGGAAVYTSDKNTEQNKEDFDNSEGPYNILVSCGKLVEGYNNPDISVCVILRKVGSSNMFSQFVGRCLRRRPNDPVVAAVRSVTCFEQQVMWDEYDNVVADSDPEDDPDI